MTSATGSVLRGDRSIYLVGFMGCGKSTVAPILAARLGWSAFDTDEEVERREKRDIARIFEESGEAAFRRAESEVLRSLAGRPRTVIACGGGLFLGPAERRFLLREGRTVWLDVAFPECLRRVGDGAGRPVWASGDPLALRALYERRRAAYALAGLRLRVAAEPPERTAERLVGCLRGSFP